MAHLGPDGEPFAPFAGAGPDDSRPLSGAATPAGGRHQEPIAGDRPGRTCSLRGPAPSPDEGDTHDTPSIRACAAGESTCQVLSRAAAASRLCVALDGLAFEVAARPGLRPARSQRRRQVHHREDPGHAHPADRGTAVVAGLDVAADPVAYAGGSAWSRSGRRATRSPPDGRTSSSRRRIQGLSKAEANARADWLLDRFGLADAADRLVRTWSGGMSRKLDVRSGWSTGREVLFLDEPTTGLDPEARAELWAEIGRSAGDDAHDGPADDALPRRGGPPGPPAGDRRPRSGRGRGDARGAQERAAGRHRAWWRSPPRPTRSPPRPARWRASPACHEVGHGRDRAAGSRRPRRARRSGRVRGARRARDRGRQRHGRAALAGRRLPALRRSRASTPAAAHAEVA